MSRAYKVPKAETPKVPSPHDWRTTDEDEINKRRLRAQAEQFVIANCDPAYPIYSNFQVRSKSGLEYAVEIRDLEQKHHSCTCVDFQVNGLGTCKHIEGVLAYLEARFPRLFKAAWVSRSPRFEVVPDPGAGTLTIENPEKPLPIPLRRMIQSGIITPQVRATRSLFPVLEPESLRQSLSPQEKERANGHRGQAARKFKMAQLLFQGELLEEARQALEEGLHCLGRAMAVEQRQGEPADLKTCLLPPLAHAWKESQGLVRWFVEDPQQMLDPVLQQLNKLVTIGAAN